MSLTSIPYAYFAPHAKRMKALAINWEKGTVGAVLPSQENVLKGTYNPLSRPLFIYVSRKAAEQRPEVRDFVEFYLKHGAQLAQEVKYLPLPDVAYQMGLERFKKRQIGTGFGGTPEVGLPVEEILRREPKS